MSPLAELARQQFNYDPETGVISRKSGRLFKTGPGRYLTVRFNEANVAAHRVIWLWMTGEWPQKEIDHIDKDKWNNKWNNLRDVSRTENNLNHPRHFNNSSGHTGVSFKPERGKWVSYLNGKYLGIFDTKQQAVECRSNAVGRFYEHPE